MSDDTTEKYVISIAKNAKSEGHILDKLFEANFPINQQVKEFAHSLFVKYAPQAPTPAVLKSNDLKKHEELQKRPKLNENYSILKDDESEDEEGDDMDSQQLKFFKDLEDIKRRRKELENEVLNAGAEDTTATGDKPSINKKEKKELKKLLKEKDKLERDALVTRMLERDKERTKQKGA